MDERYKRAILALALSMIAVACGKVAASSGGDTHWLGQCDTDRDCQGGACLCGICTKTCSSDDACGASGKSAACFDLESPGVQARCAGVAPKGAKGICLATCDAKASCGGGTACLQGACVRSSASLDGGAVGDPPPNPAGSVDSGTANTGGAGGASGVGSGGTDAGVTTTGSAGEAADAAASCYVPSNALPTGTPEERQRAQLIHDFCVNLGKNGCLPFQGGTSFIAENLRPECGSDKLTHACELDVANEYAQWGASCDAAWQTAITCAKAATYTEPDCNAADLGSSSSVRTPCDTEKNAYQMCLASSTPSKVAGSRTICEYGPGLVSPCEVNCDDNRFTLDCGGPAGLPYRCECSVNGHPLGDLQFSNFPAKVIYASDCADAAKQAASGTVCTNRVDCCVKYTSSGADKCVCGADPSLFGGAASCDALAQSMNGQVVMTCPQYEPSFP